MYQALQLPDVLTVDEAARYLRVSKDVLKRLAAQGKIPGRKIDRHWRFLKAGLDDWLRGVGSRDGRSVLLEQAGALKDDETLPALRAAIYAGRVGRRSRRSPGRNALPRYRHFYTSSGRSRPCGSTPS